MKLITAQTLMSCQYNWLFNILWYLASDDVKAEYVYSLDIYEYEEALTQTNESNITNSVTSWTEIDTDEIPF